MAFSAVRSLKSEIEKYLIGHDNWVDPSSREMLEFAYNQVQSSLEFSKRVFPSYFLRRPPIGHIEGAVRKLNAALESRVSKQIDPQSESGGEGIHNLEKEIHFFTETMQKLEEEFDGELYNSLTGGEEEEDGVVSDGGDKSKMVGLSDQYNHLKQRLTNISSTEFKVVSLCGMPGIGKTTLAREIFEDPDIVELFDCRVSVTVGRKCEFKEIPLRILVELNPDGD